MSKIADLVKYEGDNSTFIWKHPCEDFNSLTQLVVHESQEAIFFMNGQALDLFGPGKYTLETQNIPKLGKYINKSTVDETPFHCEVYFINQTIQMGLKWGTQDQIRFLEPTYNVPLQIGASGEMNLMVSDSRKLLVKLVGTMNGIAWDEGGSGFTKSLQNSFRAMMNTALKAHLASTIKNENINILEIDENLEQLSEMLKKEINPSFEEYGLTMPNFYVTTVVLPENDPNFRKIRELHSISLQNRMTEAEALVRTEKAKAEASVLAAQRNVEMERQLTETEIAKREAERKIIEAQTEAASAKLAGFAEAEVMQAKGYNQKDVLQAEVQKAYAEGIGQMGAYGGGGGITGDIVGLSAGLAAAGAISGQMGEIFKGITNPGSNEPAPAKKETVCPNCGNKLPENAKFCLECGTKIELVADDEIICPSCGKKIKKGKFCLECGAPLIIKCASCGTELPSGSKFCPECGTKREG